MTRFTFEDAPLRAATDDPVEAARLQLHRPAPQVTADAELVYVGRPLRTTDEGYPNGARLLIWSDGLAHVRTLYPTERAEPVGDRLVEDAEWLIRQALREPAWHSRWQEFADVIAVRRTQLDHQSQRRAFASWELTTERLDATHADGREETLYFGALYAGVLGEDGDAWEEFTLVANKAALAAWARAQRAIYR